MGSICHHLNVCMESVLIPERHGQPLKVTHLEQTLTDWTPAAGLTGSQRRLNQITLSLPSFSFT